MIDYEASVTQRNKNSINKVYIYYRKNNPLIIPYRHYLKDKLYLHEGVGRSPATLWHSPFDELLRCLDRARLAVHTVLRVDDEVALAGRIGLRVLIHTRGTEALFGSGILLD